MGDFPAVVVFGNPKNAAPAAPSNAILPTIEQLIQLNECMALREREMASRERDTLAKLAAAEAEMKILKKKRVKCAPSLERAILMGKRIIKDVLNGVDPKAISEVGGKLALDHYSRAGYPKVQLHHIQSK